MSTQKKVTCDYCGQTYEADQAPLMEQHHFAVQMKIARGDAVLLPGVLDFCNSYCLRSWIENQFAQAGQTSAEAALRNESQQRASAERFGHV